MPRNHPVTVQTFYLAPGYSVAPPAATQHEAVVVDDREDLLARLAFVTGIADAIAAFLGGPLAGRSYDILWIVQFIAYPEDRRRLK